jgi:hypothetical protein
MWSTAIEPKAGRSAEELGAIIGNLQSRLAESGKAAIVRQQGGARLVDSGGAKKMGKKRGKLEKVQESNKGAWVRPREIDLGFPVSDRPKS